MRNFSFENSKEEINNYPQNETELAIELLDLTSQAAILLKLKNSSEVDESKVKLRNELSESFVNAAKEIEQLYRDPEKKAWWPSGPKNWKEALDFLRKTISEMRRNMILDEKDKEIEISEMKLKADERKKLFVEKMNKLRNKPLTNSPGTGLYNLTEVIEEDFNKAQQQKDEAREKIVWKTINELLENDISTLEELSNIIDSFRKDFGGH